MNSVQQIDDTETVPGDAPDFLDRFLDLAASGSFWFEFYFPRKKAQTTEATK